MRRKRRQEDPAPSTATRERLTRLAWGLARLGLTVSVQLPRRDEPCVAVQRVSGPLVVRASLRGDRWVFSWGRGRDRCVDVGDESAFERVWEVAQ